MNSEVTDLNKPIDTTAVSVGATATALIGSPNLARNRRGVLIQPTNGDIYLGGRSVTTSTGIIVRQDRVVFLEWTYGGEWFAVRSGGSNVDVRVLPVEG